MCSRFALTADDELVQQHFATLNYEPFPARYNIAPTQPVAIVKQDNTGQRSFDLARWGFIPGWAKDIDKFSTLINARSETVLEKPSFKHAMKYRRCLFPATCFYEWTGAKGHKRPYMIAPNVQQEPEDSLLAFAGIWEHWMSPDGSEIETAAILTTEANGPVSFVHSRMPVILPKAQFDPWLDILNVSSKEARQLCQPAPDELLNVTEISTLVNSPRNMGAEVQKPVQGSLF